MKYLPGCDGQMWNDSLLKDLQFIKLNLRYPFSKKTVTFTLLFAVLLFAGVRTGGYLYVAVHSRSNLLALCAIPLLLACIAGACYRYYRNLKFSVISTSFTATDNIKLIELFLRSQHLAVYRHPDVAGLFQIASRAIGGGKNPAREIMIFIADDNRILINSHFINQRFAITPPSRNSENMARRLKEWIVIHQPLAQGKDMVAAM